MISKTPSQEGLSQWLATTTRPLLHASLLLLSLSFVLALLLLHLVDPCLAGSQLEPGGSLTEEGTANVMGQLCDRWGLGCPSDECRGAYVYVYDDMPGELNTDMPQLCSTYRKGFDCPYYENDGIGEPDISLNWTEPSTDAPVKLLTPRGTWFESQNVGLDLLMHKRMLSHKCRTRDPEKATAFYIPFYGTLDWEEEGSRKTPDPGLVFRDRRCRALLEYLQTKPSWRRNGGLDHFLALGYPPVFYSRDWTNPESRFGRPLLSALPNVTLLLVEWSAWWGSKRFVSIPYTTGFHPRDQRDVAEWRERVEQVKRDTLVTMVGRRRGAHGSVGKLRDVLFEQCNSTTVCTMAECMFGTRRNPCYSNELLMQLLTRSQFCLQPPGDTPTRKSTFDALLAGCIPVFMDKASIENQYPLFFPEDSSTFSVFIPREEISSGAVNVVEVLEAIPEETISKMRRTILDLLPHVVYFQDVSRREREGHAPRRAAAEVVTERADVVDIALAHMLAKVQQQQQQQQKQQQHQQEQGN